MTTRRWVMLVLLVCISIVFAGCGTPPNPGTAAQDAPSQAPASSQSAAAQNEASAAPAASEAVAQAEPLQFSWYVNYDWFTPEPWGVDPTSKWLLDNKNVVIEWTSPSGAAASKLNTMIASGDLPDVLVLERGADIERLASAGMLVPLDGYLENSNLGAKVDPGILNMLRSSDGKLYCFPNYYLTGDKGNGNSGWMINTKIHKALGSPKLQTFDDLTAYLQQVKEEYPDVVPLELGSNANGFPVIVSGFTEQMPNTYIKNLAYPEGDQLQSIFTAPAVKEALTYSSQLFGEKLISQDTFTQTKDQFMEKLSNGKVAVVAGVVATDGQKGLIEWKKQDPDAGYEVIWPIHKAGLDPQKIKVDGYGQLGWNCNVISTNAADPAAIFGFLDWMTSTEGQQVVMFGPPGVLWDKVEDGVPIPNEASKTMSDEEKGKVGAGWYNWVGDTTYVDTTKTRMQLMLPEDQREFTTMAQYNVTWKTSMPDTEFSNLQPLPDTPEGIALQTASDLWKEYLAKIFFATSDQEVTSLLEEAQQKATDAGFDQTLTYMTQKWQENRERLNLQ